MKSNRSTWIVFGLAWALGSYDARAMWPWNCCCEGCEEADRRESVSAPLIVNEARPVASYGSFPAQFSLMLSPAPKDRRGVPVLTESNNLGDLSKDDFGEVSDAEPLVAVNWVRQNPNFRLSTVEAVEVKQDQEDLLSYQMRIPLRSLDRLSANGLVSDRDISEEDLRSKHYQRALIAFRDGASRQEFYESGGFVAWSSHMGGDTRAVCHVFVPKDEDLVRWVPDPTKIRWLGNLE